jgi:hypothetical protein
MEKETMDCSSFNDFSSFPTIVDEVLFQQDESVKASRQLCSAIEGMKKQIQEDLILMDEVRKYYEKNIFEFQDEIKLNVGGTRFTTSKATLLTARDSFFSCMMRRFLFQVFYGFAFNTQLCQN